MSDNVSTEEQLLDLAHEIGVMYVNQRRSDLLVEKLEKTALISKDRTKVLEESIEALNKNLNKALRDREELANTLRGREIPLSARAQKG